jgi:PAS domain S-box-containing protein
MSSSFFSSLFEQNYIPHGVCLLWQPGLLWLHVFSDAVIALSYYTIPFALIWFVSKRRDLAFRGIFVLTGAFILACGTTHVMGIVTLWYPDYWLDGMIKLFTALVSIATAFAMWRAMPLALALPSTAQLRRVNSSLEQAIGERQRAEAALRDANAELENRVAARTAELEAEIAQRRNAEATLRASEERWRGMFEASAVGIALTDENQRFVAVNGAFQKMLGYSEAELLALGPIQITHDDERRATREMIDRMMADPRTGYDVEKRYLRKDGTVIWVRVSTARASDPDSGLRGIPTIIADITERKHAEDSLHDARETLVRVARLSTMGELSASIAHEINQPLGAIVANGNACRRFLAEPDPDIGEAQEAIQEIISDGRRASEVLTRVRALVRNTAPERRLLDVNDAIREVLALARHELHKNRVSVRTQLDPRIPCIHADKVQLQQVVLNLIMNGIEAMREIENRSRVLTLASGNGSNQDVIVSVEDSGEGIDPADLSRVFDPFFTTKAEGMGIGLSICNSIVRAHGGRLSVAAGVPHGAVFRFTLPALVEAAA